jgi:hypothetical protein
MLGMPAQKRIGIRAQIHRHIPDLTAQASDQFGLWLYRALVMQTPYATSLAGAGMVDLADMKRLAERAQAALAEQPGKMPALVFEAFVLDAEQPGKRQRL